MNNGIGRSSKRIGWWAGLALVVLATVGGTWGAYRAARAEEAPPRLAGAMPQGALVYLEARDLHALLGAWVKSPTRERYFQSASYRSFKRSRLYLKLQDRLGDLQKGFGVDVTDERLAELVGGPSAIAIYDPGKLDVLVVTEVPSERALASSLFAQAKNFEERKTAKGAPYFAREVVSDEGGLQPQRIAFGYASGRLWIGTSETTVAEAIDGPANGGLSAQVGETIRAAGDFSAHDMLVWMDLERSVRNKYFDLYWIQRNGKDLQDLASGVIDLEFAADGVHERRWFVTKTPATATGGGDGAALAVLRSYAPADAQLVTARAADPGVSPAIAETLFGPERSTSTVESVYANRTDDPFDQDSSDNGSSRYRYLDSRFDADVDDPSTPAVPVPASAVKPKTDTAQPSFGDRVTELVAAAAPVRYATYSSIRLPEGQLFATFDRTVVVELSSPERFAAPQFEALVSGEFVRRFVVGGDVSKVSWTDASGARSLAGSLVQQGGAYTLAGSYLVVANDAAACAATAARLRARADAPPIGAPAGTPTTFAEVRVDAARGPYVRLTSVLDATSRASLEQNVDDGSDGDSTDDRPVLFFSENVASLLDVVRELATVRVSTSVDGTLVRERVDYLWASSAQGPTPAPTRPQRKAPG